jgi:ATP-dependent Lon protease
MKERRAAAPDVGGRPPRIVANGRAHAVHAPAPRAAVRALRASPPKPLPKRLLRWRCDPKKLRVDDVGPRDLRAAQTLAWDALSFAIRCDAPNQHAFVRGLVDTRRTALVLEALDELRPPPAPAPDRVYVRNTKEPHRPHLLTLKSGSARRFARAIRRLAEFVRDSSAMHRGRAAGARRRDEARAELERRVARIRAAHRGAGVAAYLAEIVEEILENRFGRRPASPGDPTALYSVNVVLCHDETRSERPIVVEDEPTPAKLLGTLAGESGSGLDEHARIRPGALVQASGGYLVLDAARLIGTRGSWDALVATIRSGRAEVMMPERSAASLRPEPVPVKLRVILVGDRNDYAVLDGKGEEFAHHFKVLADLDCDMDRDAAGFRVYAASVARLGRVEGLRPFDRPALAQLIDHGARIAGRGGKITARLGRIADVAREADFVAAGRGASRVRARDVKQAVQRTKARASLDARRFLEFVRERAIRIDVHGAVVGQINGLSVIHAGPITYGFPARITASVGAGSEGVLDVESRAELSGSIHTKGFQIFQGLLRRMLETDHPLAFTASLASEQTYGRVDGDSSSAAQLCCLLSALARAPIRQGLAATGSIDQLGHVQAVGALDEKIEGFFDVCRLLGFDDTQGVVIPAANTNDLMLREDVVDACARGRFHVYTVDTIYELLSVLTGMPATPPRADGTYAPDSLLARAVAGSRELWEETARLPRDEPSERRTRKRIATNGIARRSNARRREERPRATRSF